MQHATKIAGLALLAACAGALASAAATPAQAGGWRNWDGDAAPRYHSRRSYRITPRYDGNLRYYNSPSTRAYRSVCAYGDCGCLRAVAERTGNPVWWDKYQACSGN